MADMYSLYSADEPTAQEQAAAMAAALRRQKDLGNLAMLTGDPMLAKFGQTQLQGAGDQEQMIAHAGQSRAESVLRKALQAQSETFQSGESNKTRTFEGNEHALNRAMQMSLGKWGHIVNPMTGEVYKQDLRTGDATPISGPVAGGAAGGGLKPAQMEKEWKDLAESVSTVRGRGNLNRENQGRLYAAERLEKLILGPDGNIQNLTPQQLREAGTALANLISQGSMSISQIEELTPSTMAGQLANVKQRLLNEPTGAEAQAFLANMLETAGREKAVITSQIATGQRQGIPNYARLRGVDRARFDSILKGAGIEPGSIDDAGLAVKSQPKTSAHPQDGEALEWAKQHPEDPRAKRILEVTRKLTNVSGLDL
jgi:hypothetical protein